MKSDEQIATAVIREKYHDTEADPDVAEIACVRAGREAVLKQVVEREEQCSYIEYFQHRVRTCLVDKSTELDAYCIHCWATVQLGEIKDA